MTRRISSSVKHRCSVLTHRAVKLSRQGGGHQLRRPHAFAVRMMELRVAKTFIVVFLV